MFRIYRGAACEATDVKSRDDAFNSKRVCLSKRRAAERTYEFREWSITRTLEKTIFILPLHIVHDTYAERFVFQLYGNTRQYFSPSTVNDVGQSRF